MSEPERGLQQNEPVSTAAKATGQSTAPEEEKEEATADTKSTITEKQSIDDEDLFQGGDDDRTSSSSSSGANMLSAERANSTASLSASIMEYREMYGRRYHSDRGNAQYFTPNDEASTESLDLIHHVLTLSLGGRLYLAPLTADKDAEMKVVDVGTGTGIWAIDFADERPNADVIGTDISPIQPDWVPPNLHFEMDDCTQDWTFREGSLDYVHMRWLFGSIADWPALFAQAYKCLKPGGWVESHEPSVQFHSDDGSVRPGSAMDRFGRIFVEGGEKMGRPMTVVEDDVQARCAEGAGFVDVRVEELRTPIGGWPADAEEREIGRCQKAAVEGDIEGTLLHIAVGVLDWTKEEVIFFGSKMRREMRSPDIHGYFKQKIVVARKPPTSG